MKKAVVLAGAILAAAVLGAWFYATEVYEPPLASGPLTEALMGSGTQEERTAYFDEVYARFIPPDSPLEDRIPTLLANGFRCDLHVPSKTRESLVCVRPIEGTGYCKGFRYYAFRNVYPDLGNAEYRDTAGSTYDDDSGEKWLGRCKAKRESFFELMLANEN